MSGTAPAQSAQDAAPQSLDLTIAGAKGGCKPAPAGEVVVCGERGKSPYRIDSDELAVIRAKEAASHPPRVDDRSATAEACGTVRNECGGGTIPLLQPALRVASAVVKAVEGEDWREPFRNGPTDYQRHQAAKSTRARFLGGFGFSAKAGN